MYLEWLIGKFYDFVMTITFITIPPCCNIFYLFIECFTAQVLKVCRTSGTTACSKTKMLHLDKVLVEIIRNP